jgi:anti-anti-sigma factor
MTPAITLGRMPVEKWSDSVVVVHLGDDPRFSEEMEAASGMTPPCHSAVLDFSAIHYINSSNIASLLRLRRQIHDQNGKLILCNVGNPVWTTFLITGLDKIFEFTENVPTALATIQLHEPDKTGKLKAE